MCGRVVGSSRIELVLPARARARQEGAPENGAAEKAMALEARVEASAAAIISRAISQPPLTAPAPAPTLGAEVDDTDPPLLVT